MTCGQHRRCNQPIQIRPRRCACAFGVSAGRANSSRQMAEAMHLQQVAMDARDGFRFCQSRAASGSARRRVKLARPLWGQIRRFKTPISGQLVGRSIVGLNPMAAKGFKRRSAPAPSDLDRGFLSRSDCFLIAVNFGHSRIGRTIFRGRAAVGTPHPPNSLTPKMLSVGGAK